LIELGIVALKELGVGVRAGTAPAANAGPTLGKKIDKRTSARAAFAPRKFFNGPDAGIFILLCCA
jgi:hypothetical protein